jgi:NitT/TauT family transport system permease protein
VAALRHPGGELAFARPPTIVQSLIAGAEGGTLLLHLGITLARVGIGFAIAMVVGVALGIALGRLQWLDRWLHPWMVILLNVPALVIIILSYVWLDLVSGGDDDAA